MKTSNKSSFITGIVLLVIAALFSISLILQPLDFGLSGPGHNNIFYLLGNMLYSVYGFSSILIPAFMLVAGLSCFASQWTARKTMRLLTALVPFFTCVITENICRSILALGRNSFSGVKIAVAIITGIMLVVIEYLGTGIIADKISKKSPKKHENDDISEFKKIGKLSLFKNHKKNETENSDDLQDDVENSVFDEALQNVSPREPASESGTSENLTSNEPATDESAAPSAAEDDGSVPQTPLLTQEEYAALTSNEEDLGWNLPPAPESLPPEYDEDFDENDPALEFPPKEEAENDESAQETAYAEPAYDNGTYAEDSQDDAESEETKELHEEDDVENADYLDESDEESAFSPSPVLESAATSSESTNEDEDNEAFNAFNYEVENIEDSENDGKSEDDEAYGDYSADVVENHFAPVFDNDDDDFIEWPDEEASADEDSVEEVEEAYPKSESFTEKKTPYHDSVVENPNFPHGIVIHDDSEADDEENPAENSVPEAAKPKFPSKIQLQSSPEPDADDDFDDYVEDETLPFPKFDLEEPAINSRQFDEESADYESTPYEDVPVSNISAGADTPSAAAVTVAGGTAGAASVVGTAASAPAHAAVSAAGAASASAVPSAESAAPAAIAGSSGNALAAVAPKANISSAAFSVFSDMENEIRENQAAHPQPAIAQAASVPVPQEGVRNTSAQNAGKSAPAQPVEVDYEGNVISEDDAPNLEDSATNLTADELTDFFNAQQEENTPKTREIEEPEVSGPPKLSRTFKSGPYIIPSDLLIAYKDDQYWIIDDATKQAAMNLKQTLSEFNIEAEIIGIKKGPVVTMFEILPAPGVKLSKIVALQDNIALSLAAQSVRIVAPIPGKQAVGIEVPNKHRSVVGFREIIEMDLPEWQKMAVPVILGKDILGKAQLIDLVKTPHMLIAGATGSGKSVCVNSLILSILYKRSFHDVKMILVDPKVVELKLYNNIPHLLTPVITEPKKALQALQYCLCEMERRYALLDGMGVRDISNYNQKIKEQHIATEKLPYIVVIIDEFADLMATSGKELETIVARLTAMSRAVGIHLVLATQRPSVNVITGLIKANIPTRIAFMVASRTDSNIIIDTVGAEKLLGRGDMLYASAVDPAPIRIQGTFVTDQEVEDVVNAVKEYGEPDYIDDEIFIDDDEEEGARDLFGEPMDDDDPLYDQALEIVVQSGKASASYIQRRLKIGYNRAARLVEEMEERGIVGPANGSKPREIIHIP